MASATIPAKSRCMPDFVGGALTLGVGISFLMAHAHDFAYRIGSCGVAVGTGVAGLVAQADSPTAGQVGELGVYAGVTYLVIAVIREGAPPLQRIIETMATSRNDRVRLEAKIEHLAALHAEDLTRIESLATRLAEAEEAAREAKNLLENAKIEVAARTDAIEQKAREVGHMARNNAQRLQNVEEALLTGSGDRDPESAL